MPSRFASNTDYSQTFTSLYEQNRRSMESAALRIDAQRESELAAKDSLVFTKWQEGKISGSQLMAHIRARQSQTSYDRAQQLKWQEAAITYGDVIADERAEAAYAESGNINALIIHYAGRLANAKNGTPERRELAQRVKSLRETRDSESLRKQGRKIARAIARGDMNTQDLISFYKEKLPGLSGELRQQVLDTLAELRSKRRTENFETAMQKIDNELATGRISPQDAAKQKTGVLQKFEIENSDKLSYNKWLEQIRQLQATPDPVEVAALDFDLASGNITPEQYIDQINVWADQVAPYDQEASWNLRIEAQNFMEERATPLGDPSILGQSGFRFASDGSVIVDEGARRSFATPGGGSRGFTGTVAVVEKLKGNAIKHITQMDGSRYSALNCTMAAGAMLAHTMGFKTTGADLRAATGDTVGGTTLKQLAGALNNAGVEGTRLAWEQSVGFEAFKKRVANGAPAVLSGWNGDIPSQFNSSGIIAGHAMFVAGYSDKKKAFLMLDPAKSKDSGTWWPESIVEDFGWVGQRNGQALFAPQGTIDQKTLARSIGVKVKHISVNAKPTKPETPPMTQFDPGPKANGELEKLLDKKVAENRERLRDGRIDDETIDSLTTQQAVKGLIQDRDAEIANLQDVLDKAVQSVEDNGGEFDGTVELTATGEVMTREELAEIQKQLIYMYDAQSLLYESIEEHGDARRVKGLKEGVLVSSRMFNSLEKEYAVNVQLREVRKGLDSLRDAKSPAEYGSILEDVVSDLTVIGTLDDDDPGDEDDAVPENTQADKEANLVDTGTLPASDKGLGEWDQLIEAITGDYEDPNDLAEALVEIVPEMTIAGTDDGLELLENLELAVASGMALQADEEGHREATMILVPDLTTGQHEMMIIPTTLGRVLDENGELQEIDVPDLSALDPAYQAELAKMGYDASTLPIAQVPGLSEVDQIPVIPMFMPYAGVKMLRWNDGLNNMSTEARLQILDETGLTSEHIKSGQLIPEVVLAALETSPNAIEGYKASGLIVEEPWGVQQVHYDGGSWYGDELDTPEGVQVKWHKGAMPHVGKTITTDGIPVFGGEEYGGTYRNNGRPWIDYTPGEIDDTDTGSFVINLGVTPEQSRQDLIDNGGVPDTVYARDPDNPAEVAPISRGNPQHPLNPRFLSLPEYMQERRGETQKIADGIIAQMADPIEAAELAEMSDSEIRALAPQFNIGQDGQRLPIGTAPGGAAGVAEKLPLGITGTQPQEEPEPAQTFDIMAAAHTSGLSVAARNAADRKAAIARKAAAQEALKNSTSGLARITSPLSPGAKAAASLPGVPKTSVAPKPKPVIPAFPKPPPRTIPSPTQAGDNPFKSGRAL